jgi:hypothetical protein
MIARVWKGAVRKEDSEAYSAYMQETTMRSTPTSSPLTPDHRTRPAGVWVRFRRAAVRHAPCAPLVAPA